MEDLGHLREVFHFAASGTGLPTRDPVRAVAVTCAQHAVSSITQTSDYSNGSWIWGNCGAATMRKNPRGAKRQRFAFSRSRENTDRNAHRRIRKKKLRVAAPQSSSLFSTLQIVVILNNVAGKGIPIGRSRLVASCLPQPSQTPAATTSRRHTQGRRRPALPSARTGSR